ncbi:aspartate--tRNA(Asn) ligase [archaeon]|jgi:nondiscriminating aspartyl-tRNA synthetase|nr:aspartate--tRNA(Asn) ligase [archaeon]
MKRTYIEGLKSGKVMIKGWVHEMRGLAKLKFLLIRDMSGMIQCVVKGEELMKAVDDLSLESVVEISGEIKEANVKAENARDDVELVVESIVVLNKAEKLPIHVNEKTINTDLSKRLDNRFLDTRKPKVGAIFNIRSKMLQAVTDFYSSKKFKLINTPKITTIGLESGAESFEVKYFKDKAVLAQSPQFYKQMFVMGGFERVFEIGAVYRAEKSNTTRHLTEFTGADFEMGFIEDETEVMDIIEEMFKETLGVVKKECAFDLEKLNVDLMIPKKIPRVPMSELKEYLKTKGKKLSEDDDLDSEAERMIGEYALEKYGEEFIFVTNYPWEVRPFYHMKPENDPKGTRSFDLLWRGVEIATGAQREHRVDVLRKQAKEKGMKIPKIYEDIFRYGSIPHGGVGFGLDRIIQRMLNLDNTREAVLLPRDPTRLTP